MSANRASIAFTNAITRVLARLWYFVGIAIGIALLVGLARGCLKASASRNPGWESLDFIFYGSEALIIALMIALPATILGILLYTLVLFLRFYFSNQNAEEGAAPNLHPSGCSDED